MRTYNIQKNFSISILYHIFFKAQKGLLNLHFSGLKPLKMKV